LREHYSGRAPGASPGSFRCCRLGAAFDIRQPSADNRLVSDPYAADAPFYDLVHVGHEDDIGLWLSFAGRTDRPVLEAGCGTGRITLALARAGHAVTGVDPSPAMLEIARKAADDDALDDAVFYEGELTTVSLPEDHFGFVLVPADVFLYCRDGEDQLANLRAIAATLHFSGQLAIDLPGPASSLDPATNGQPVLVHSAPLDDGAHLDVWQVHEDDLALQTRTLRVTYERTSVDGLVHRTRSEHNLRYVHRFEAEYLLHLAGLVLIAVYGDYELGPLTNDSERMIVVARGQKG
jgi:SAM-dependent methyltransferase